MWESQELGVVDEIQEVFVLGPTKVAGMGKKG
jgi:hypothetical protein